ncbi:hypothetical protein ABW19_dt0203246 [Dactylella cylindrospora]|nr:hypothetical protein ABW19_dt0203246 [Dactylella cylindrospora]
MGSKIPPLTTTLLQSLIADSSSSGDDVTPLIAAFSTLEPRASITTIDPSSSEALSTYYACYILALVLDDDLNEARHLTYRIDSSLLRNDPVIISTYRLLQSLWQKDYVAFHQTIQNAPWGDVTTVLVSRVLQKHRTSTLRLLSTAYTALPPSLAQKYLGISDEGRTIKILVEENSSLGWSFDAEQGVLTRTESDGIIGTGGSSKVKRGAAKEGEIARLAGLGGFLSDQ